VERRTYGRREAHPPATFSDQRPIAFHGMTISILVVEDQTGIRDRVRQLLEGEGYVVHTADGPDEAMALLQRLPRPCLLFWDAVTPRQSLTMVDHATMEGVHVAALPVSVLSMRLATHPDAVTKRLTSEEAILAIVRKHCPLPERAIA
jgi:CheY-like chemotaxis protein